MAGLTVHASEFAKFEISRAGADWRELPGVSAYNETGGDAPTRDIVAFQGVAQRAGRARLPSIEITAIHAPAHSAWRDLYTAFTEGETRQIRLTTNEETLYESAATNGAMAAIATNGVVTFTKGATNNGQEVPNTESNDYAPGMTIRIGANNHVIEQVSDAGVITVGAITTAVAASSFSIRLPAMRRGPMVVAVAVSGRAALSAEGQLESTATFSPRGELPDWVIV